MLRHLWQLKAVVFLHRCLIFVILLILYHSQIVFLSNPVKILTTTKTLAYSTTKIISHIKRFMTQEPRVDLIIFRSKYTHFWMLDHLTRTRFFLSVFLLNLLKKIYMSLSPSAGILTEGEGSLHYLIKVGCFGKKGKYIFILNKSWSEVVSTRWSTVPSPLVRIPCMLPHSALANIAQAKKN